MGIDWSQEKNLKTLKVELEKLVEYYSTHRNLKPAHIVSMNIVSCENKKVMQKWCGVGRELMTVNVDGEKYPCNFITPMTFTKEELNLLMKTDFTNIRSYLIKIVLITAIFIQYVLHVMVRII